MKILLISDASLNPTDATPAFARRIARELARAGRETHLLELIKSREYAHADAGGVREHPLYCEDEKELHAITGGNTAGKSKPAIALKLLSHPKATLAAFRLVVLGNGPAQAALQSEIERIVRENGVEAAVAFAAPHQTVFALRNARVKCAKYAVMYDPYSTLPLYSSLKYRRREARLYECARRVFITHEMREQLEKTELERFAHKLIELPFPAVVPASAAPRPEFLKTDKTNLVFVGNFYAAIRSPQFFLELFSELGDPSLRFVVVGGGQGGFPDGFFETWQARLGERLVMTGEVSRETAYAAMSHADVLVNIGNSEPGQLPSKVFDYMCAGRPILDIRQCEGDPAAEYFAKYPLCLTINAADGATRAACGAVGRFVAESAGQQVDYTAVARALEEYTPAAVAKRLLQAVEETV